MKVIAVLGSGRQASRSGKVAEKMIEGAWAAGHEVKTYFLGDVPLIGCRACLACRRQNQDCVLPDALAPYWQELSECGALILGAPNYNSLPSGTMITFMNRHYCMLTMEKKPRLDHDVKLLTVFAQGASASYTAYQGNYDWYANCFRSKRIVECGRLVVGGDSDLNEDSPLLQEAFRMGFEL